MTTVRGSDRSRCLTAIDLPGSASTHAAKYVPVVGITGSSSAAPVRPSGGGCWPGPTGLVARCLRFVTGLLIGFLGGQWCRDVLQALLLRLNTQHRRNESSGNHEGRSDRERMRGVSDLSGLDQVGELQRAGDARGSSADRIEEGNRQRAGFHGKTSLTVR